MITLSEADLEFLSQGERVFQLGGREIPIRPLSLKAVVKVANKLMALRDVVQSHALPDGQVEHSLDFGLLLEKFQEEGFQILQEATGIEAASLGRLPLDVVSGLALVAWEVNKRSLEVFQGNFMALVSKPPIAAEVQA